MVKRIAQVLSVSVVMLLVGCGSTPPKTPTFTRIDLPELNEIVSIELGGTAISHIYSSTRSSFRILELFSSNALPGQFLPVGYVLTPIGEDKKYIAFAEMGLCFVKEQKKLAMAQSSFGRCNAVTMALGGSSIGGRIAFEPAEYVDMTHPNLKQELIYNGKVGSSIKFMYRELRRGLVSDPLTQDLQYDLKEGRNIEFKGARLEIIEATSRKLVYKVISFFSRD